MVRKSSCMEGQLFEIIGPMVDKMGGREKNLEKISGRRGAADCETVALRDKGAHITDCTKSQRFNICLLYSHNSFSRNA